METFACAYLLVWNFLFLAKAYTDTTSTRFRDTIQLKFVWYDLWIGVYWDAKQKDLYLCLTPCIVWIFRCCPKHWNDYPDDSSIP